MATQGYRTCAATQDFNTGVSRCLIDPDKIKGLIFVQHGYKLPADLTAESLRTACHADRPNRIYPIIDVIEYATTGGEAQVSSTGYGANKLTIYSARTDTFTLQGYDLQLRANLATMKNITIDVYPFDANNVIYGMNDGTDQLAGIELSGVYPSGQDWDSSGQDAFLAVNVMFKDAEKYIKNANIMQATFNVDDALTGLTYVDFIAVESGKYKIIEHFGKLDVTAYYAPQIADKATSVLNGASSVSYDSQDNVLQMTGTNITLKTPAVLKENGIEGIEMFV